MKYAIAVWNYCWDAAKLPGWISEFADAGFDAISLNAGQFAAAAAGHLPGVVEALRGRNLVATVHGSAAMDAAVMEFLVRGLGDNLAVFSMDSVLREDSRGQLHDAGRDAAALGRLQELTEGTQVRLAIEDFPLDTAALEFFAADLGRVYPHPRTGVLVDVGHMHMRMKGAGAFGGMSIGEYFRRLPLAPVEIHLHDNDGLKDQHGHFGFGSVPFEEVAAALGELAFDGVCTIEVAPGFHGRTPLESKVDAIRSMERWRELMSARSC